MSAVKQENSGARWFRASKADVGHAVYELTLSLVGSQGWRRTLAKIREESFVGHTLQCLGVGAFSGIDDTGEYSERNRYRIAQSVGEAAIAKIAAKQRPRGELMTTGGDYRQRIKVKHLTRAAEAPLHLPHGRWTNAWEMGERAVFRDAFVHEAGICRVRGDVENARLVYEQVRPWHLYVDEQDAIHGSPQTFVQVDRVDRSKLMEEFPKKAAAIDMAPCRLELLSDLDVVNEDSASSDMVQIIEAWRLPLSRKKKGRYVMILASGDRGADTVLIDEPWEHPNPPFGVCVWEPAPGIMGKPGIDQIIDPQNDANEMYGAMLENAIKLGNGYVLKPKGCNMGDVSSNEVGKIIEYTGSQPPTVVHPQPFNPAMTQYASVLRSMCFELSGMSETAAQGRKEAGLDSGVAVREVSDLGSERFLPKSRGYEGFWIQMTHLNIQGFADLDKALRKRGEGGLKVHYPRDAFMEEIDWKDVAIPGHELTITIAASNSFADSVASRIQTVEEMTAAGMLSRDAYMKMKAQGVPDLEAHQRRLMAQERLMERIISEMQMSEEDAAQDDFQQPDPIMNLTLAIGQMGEAYLEALADKQTPFHVLEFMRMWIREADELLNPPAPPAPEMPPGPPGLPPGATPEGMPPGGPAQPMGAPVPPMPPMAAQPV